MSTTDIVVIGVAAYFLLQGTNITSIIKDVPQSFFNKGDSLLSYIGIGGKKNDGEFLTTIERWKHLQDAVKNPETKKLLDEVFPLLVKENNNEVRT